MSTFDNIYNSVKKETIEKFLEDFKNYVIKINTEKEIITSQIHGKQKPEDYYFKDCINQDRIQLVDNMITFKFLHIEIELVFTIYADFSGETALIETCKNAIEPRKSPDKKQYYLRGLDIAFESRLNGYTYRFKGIDDPKHNRDFNTWLIMLKDNLFTPEKD